MLLRFSFLLAFIFVVQSHALSRSEKFNFHVLGNVKYRCYAGYDGKKKFDDVTNQECDNKTYQSKVIDKVVTIDLIDEPDPEDSKEISGSWLEEIEYLGRKYTIAISLFKESPSSGYRLRLVADDNEKTSRKNAVFVEFKKMNEMNPISIDYSSAGKKEEISFWVTVKSKAKKK